MLGVRLKTKEVKVQRSKYSFLDVFDDSSYSAVE